MVNNINIHNILLFILFILSATSNIYAEEKIFKVTTEAEVILNLSASASGQAVVTVFIDDKYHQDIILFAGTQRFTYKVFLGPVAAGNHKLKIETNKNYASPASNKPAEVTIDNIEVTFVDKTHPEYEGISHSPYLYARPDTIGKFSDIPLLMYYETLPSENGKLLRYTIIFSNEDGGTQTSALMARWGRTTDIEWVIETSVNNNGNPTTSIYQGIEHKTKSFKGKYEGYHPLLFVASDNNNFSDQPKSSVRFALLPMPVDLTHATRESVMDSHPWIYKLMAEEMYQEGKITDDRSLGLRISDLRNYLYIDIDSEQSNGALLSFAVKLKGQPQWYTSNMGIGYYNIERSGNYRTSIRLPKNSTIDQIENITARCDLTGNPKLVNEINTAIKAQCNLNNIYKIFKLDEKYQPSPPLRLKFNSTAIPFGEMLTIY